MKLPLSGRYFNLIKDYCNFKIEILIRK